MTVASPCRRPDIKPDSHREPSPLKAIICGYEKSGTTLLNEILRRHPQLDSGFECGLLLGNSPRDFPSIQPYYSFFRDKWKLSHEDMARACNTDSWARCYTRIRDLSPIILNKQTDLFDKTPIYMEQLAVVLERVPGVPCVVNVRDPRSLMLSWSRWSGHTEDAEQWVRNNLEQYTQRFLSYGRGYRDALPRHSERMLLNRFEPMCIDPEKNLTRLFEFLGYEFSGDYLHFSSEHFVYGNTVSEDYLYPYRDALSEDLCGEILAQTMEFSDWHYHASKDR